MWVISFLSKIQSLINLKILFRVPKDFLLEFSMEKLQTISHIMHIFREEEDQLAEERLLLEDMFLRLQDLCQGKLRWREVKLNFTDNSLERYTQWQIGYGSTVVSNLTRVVSSVGFIHPGYITPNTNNVGVIILPALVTSRNFFLNVHVKPNVVDI